MLDIIQEQVEPLRNPADSSAAYNKEFDLVEYLDDDDEANEEREILSSSSADVSQVNRSMVTTKSPSVVNSQPGRKQTEQNVHSDLSLVTTKSPSVILPKPSRKQTEQNVHSHQSMATTKSPSVVHVQPGSKQTEQNVHSDGKQTQKKKYALQSLYSDVHNYTNLKTGKLDQKNAMDIEIMQMKRDKHAKEMELLVVQIDVQKEILSQNREIFSLKKKMFENNNNGVSNVSEMNFFCLKFCVPQ